MTRFIDRAASFRKEIAYCALVAVFLGISYWPCLTDLFRIWLLEKEYSHGFFVPLISLYLVWVKREHLARLLPRPDYFFGWSALACAAVLLVLGRTGAVMQAEYLSFLLMLFAIVLLVLGRPSVKALAVPLLYLLFMTPLFDPLINRVQKPAQLITAVISSSFLSLKYPVFRDGIVVHLPDITMEVAAACSGVNFLISVVAVGVPLVYLCQHTWKRAAFVLISGCAFGLAANVVRVTLAGISGQCYGPDLLHGPHHLLQGWMISLAGWLGLFWVNRLVAGLPTESPYRLFERWKKDFPPGAVKADTFDLSLASRSAKGLLLFAVCFAIYLYGFAVPRALPPVENFLGFPEKIAGWQGEDSEWFPADTYFPGTDDQLFRMYRNDAGQRVFLFIGFFRQQLPAARVVSFMSRSLHGDAETIATNLVAPSPERINSGVLAVGDVKYLTAFWYRFPGLNITSPRQAKIRTVTDGLFKRHNNAAVVIVAVPGDRQAAEPALSDARREFLRDVSPALVGYIP